MNYNSSILTRNYRHFKTLELIIHIFTIGLNFHQTKKVIFTDDLFLFMVIRNQMYKHWFYAANRYKGNFRLSLEHYLRYRFRR